MVPEEILCATRDSFAREYKILLFSRKLFTRRGELYKNTIARQVTNILFKYCWYNYIVSLGFLMFNFLRLLKSE